MSATDVIKNWHVKRGSVRSNEKASPETGPDDNESRKLERDDSGGTQDFERELEEMSSIEQTASKPDNQVQGTFSSSSSSSASSSSYKTTGDVQREAVSRGYYTVEGEKNMSVNNPNVQKNNLIREKEKEAQKDRRVQDEAEQPPKKITRNSDD